MKRYECMEAMEPLVGDDALFALNQGGESVEWIHIHPSDGNFHGKTMGLCSSVGLGMALGLPHRPVFVMDGDGSLLMNFGTLATIGWHQPANLIHILFDNQIYESSGLQQTASATGRINFADAARAAGIDSVFTAVTTDDFVGAVEKALAEPGPHFVWARVEPGRMPGAGREKYDELESKYRFVRHIEDTEGIQIFKPSIPGSLRSAAQGQ